MVMNKRSIWEALALGISLMLIISGCQSDNRSSETEGQLAPENVEVVDGRSTGLSPLPYFAFFDEQETQLEIEKQEDFDPALLNVDSLAALLNAHFPDVLLVVERIEGSTLYVSIPDATHLTQQMGSSGAKIYLLEVTYAFTELPTVSEVNFTFPEGDHAIPGTYTRARFDQENLAVPE